MAAMREPLGKAGAPYEVYLRQDLEKIKKPYKAALILIPDLDEDSEDKIRKTLEEKGIPSLFIRSTLSTEDLRAFYRDSGVFLYCEDDDVVSCGGGLLSLHAASSGQKTLFLPKKLTLKNEDTGEVLCTDTLTFPMKEHETVLFTLS